MAINFPDSPSIGDTIAVNGSTWLWNGSTWIDAFESQASLYINSLLDVNLTSSTTGEVVQYNGSEWVNADIIAQIVDSAPGTLDTLNELAAALGDDENFASTVTTSLSGKAPTVHSHAISDVTSLQASLDARKLETTYSIAADTTLVAGGRYIVDTGSALTLTLPATPSVGDEVWVIDSTNTAATNNITVNNGGSLINGASDTLVVDVNGAIASVVYTGATLGWRI
jgi:hypothetical protein